MLRNLVRNVLSGTISGVINGSSGGNVPPPLNDRYFTQLDGQSKYWRRIQQAIPADSNLDTTLEVRFVGGSSTSSMFLISGGNTPKASRFQIRLDGSTLNCHIGLYTNSGQTVIDRSLINHAKLEVIGGAAYFYVNGVLVFSIASSQWSSGILPAFSIGNNANGSTSFFDGIIVGAVLNNSTIDNIYGLDTNLDYDLPDGVTLGPGLWEGQNYTQANNSVFSTIVSGAEWSVQSANASTNNFADGARVSSFATVIGKTYQYSVVSDEIVNVAAYRPNFSSMAKGVGSLVFTAQDTVSQLYVTPRTTNTVTFSNPTIKEIPSSALIFENGSADGSDRLLVSETTTGFLGEDGTVYDYAAGAAPPVGSYSDSYTDSYE